ncbi:MAG: hypothetical protein MK105_00545 [Crocinitomicaceae bacterium]|nr:hypothetical protein [Crocinitomicaceae bacterium]
MKYRMLSLLSIILVLSIKSMEISAKDYHELRIMVNAIPPSPYAPQIVPLILENELDSIVYQLAQANGIKERYIGQNDTINSEFIAYEKLKDLATEEDLNGLLLHDSPIVKVYAYRALLVNEMDMNCDVETALFLDTTCLDWYLDEIPTASTVGEMVQVPFQE